MEDLLSGGAVGAVTSEMLRYALQTIQNGRQFGPTLEIHKSKLTDIVQTLFEHCGLRVPEFHNDEDAVNRLRYLLSKVGRNPILLVLDDVWPGSEGLVEMIKLQMLDCKILVTSRATTFRRFGTPFQLDLLDHDHAVSLFHHFAQLNHSSSYMPDKNLVHEVLSLQSN